MQTKEMEAMLREIYGESFVDSPTAALTLKRVKGKSHANAYLLMKHATRLQPYNRRALGLMAMTCMPAGLSGRRLIGWRGKKRHNI